ncbi:MAG: amidase family protein [Pseudoxanthomonas sp.]
MTLSPSVPRVADALALGRLDAHDQAALLARGELSACELTEAAIVRIEVLDPALGALSHHAFDLGRARAAQVDAMGADRPAMGGVPLLLKDSLAWPGMPTRGGSRSRNNVLATHGHAFAQRLEAQALVPLGKTAMPEFGLLPSTEPLLGPVTRNPWNRAHSPGGSSGGAGAALAAGLVPLAHGSDGAGSIRIPASCCGVVGLKPGRGGVVRVRERHAIEDLIVSDSLMSRSVRDTAWAFAATAPQARPMVQHASNKRLRIALVEGNLHGQAAPPALQAATAQAARLCEQLGHTVELMRWPVDGAEVVRAMTTLWSHTAADCVDLTVAALGVEVTQGALEPWTCNLAHWNRKHCGIAELEHAYAQLAALPQVFDTFHQAYDVLLTPTLHHAPPRLGALSPERPMQELLAAFFDWCSYTPLQNLAGTAAISLPLAHDDAGLPLGVQFAANRGGEELLLGLAYELEAAAPWSNRWPTHSVATLEKR